MYYLVIDRTGSQTIHVFLSRSPARASAKVHLTPLDPAARVACGAIRPAVGRDPTDPHRFAEFGSVEAAALAGFEPIGLYRLCDTWEEYSDPWSVAPTDAAGTLSAGETDCAEFFPFFAPAAPARLHTV